ncbi:MAG: hypothetical protein HY700_15160 [Gemmatimonadetes bacterium]|nr:hypothetical protein [Gemmatimonadota bacterium]
MSPRSRDRILANLEAIYRDAYERAGAAGDKTRMLDLDAAYQREQLLLEVLIDIRDALTAGSSGTGSALEKLAALRRLSKSP